MDIYCDIYISDIYRQSIMLLNIFVKESKEILSRETVTMCLDSYNNVHNESHTFSLIITSSADAYLTIQLLIPENILILNCILLMYCSKVICLKMLKTFNVNVCSIGTTANIEN